MSMPLIRIFMHTQEWEGSMARGRRTISATSKIAFEYVSDDHLCIGCGICAGIFPCGIWAMEQVV